MKRAGFTLTEILVSLMIFVIVSGAMLTIMLLATRIYEDAEFGKAANDEAMAVMGMLDRDIARAVSPNDGGDFYAEVVDDSGACAVGWTVHNTDPSDVRRTRFVFWRLDQGVRTRTLSNGQTVDEAVFELKRGIYPTKNNALNNVDGTMSVVTEGCLHFGVWLVGTSHNIAGEIMRSTHPEPDRYWTRVMVRGGTNAWAEPIRAEPYDTSVRHSDPNKTPLAYPTTVRFTVVLTGGHRNAPIGRLRTEMSSGPADLTGEHKIKVQGTRGVSTLPGSILRIGDEIIGYTGFQNGEITINHAEAHGPLNTYGSGPTPGNGRGILRSTAQDHAIGDPIYFGRPFSLVKTLTR